MLGVQDTFPVVAESFLGYCDVLYLAKFFAFIFSNYYYQIMTSSNYWNKSHCCNTENLNKYFLHKKKLINAKKRCNLFFRYGVGWLYQIITNCSVNASPPEFLAKFKFQIVQHFSQIQHKIAVNWFMENYFHFYGILMSNYKDSFSENEPRICCSTIKKWDFFCIFNVNLDLETATILNYVVFL